MSGVLIISAWRQATASAQAKRPLTSFLTLSVVLLLPSCDVWAGSQNPETCLKKPFLSMLWPQTTTHYACHLKAPIRTCLQMGLFANRLKNVLLYPQRYFHPWKNWQCFLVLSGTTQLWQSGSDKASLPLEPWPPTWLLWAAASSGVNSPPAWGHCAPLTSHILTPGCQSNNSLKHSGNFGSCLWLIRFKLSLLAGQGRMKSSHSGVHRMLCPGWS